MGGLLSALLAGCSVDTEHASLVDELTVLSIIGQPPEVEPGGTLGLDIWVVDPSRRGADLLVWLCVSEDSTSCSNGVLGDFDGAVGWVGHGVDGLQQLRFEVPEEVALYLPSSDVVVPFQVWALACQPGACDIHALVESRPRWTSAAWGEMMRGLGDPWSLLDGLSMEEANLAVRHLGVSQRPPEDRNLPPLLLPLDAGPFTVRAGGELVLAFQTTDTLFVWPYTTAGRFEYARYSASQGATSMSWLAPPTPGPARLFVAADDGLGGTAMWSAEALVTP